MARPGPVLLVAGLALAAPRAAQHASAGAVLERGRWEAPFQHDLAGFDPAPERFNAVHMALVPRGPRRGQVLVWDFDKENQTPLWRQRWALLDVSQADQPASFTNGELVLPPDGGDFFCAGQAWTADGELLVAGGTALYPHAQGGATRDDEHGYHGGKLVYLFDPTADPGEAWRRQPDLAVERWYPSVTLLDTDELVIAGGLAEAGDSHNDYEVFHKRTGPGALLPAEITRFPGPPAPADPLGLYPRLHQLASGAQFLSGMWGISSRMEHDAAPGAWTVTDAAAWMLRGYGCSLLAPRRPNEPERLWTLGGEVLPPVGEPLITASMEECEPGAAGAPGWDWHTLPSLHVARTEANAVLLPDATVLVVGGRTSRLEPETFTTVPELFDGQRWRRMASGATARTYHSTAVLLPDGRVLTGGGNTATWDYQVFAPPYVGSPLRPRITSAPGTLAYSASAPAPVEATFTLAAGESVARVVLMAPGATTHHSDSSQRYVELVVTGVGPTSVAFQGPPNSSHAPRGFYLLFLVSARGMPSVARWVELR